jgi:poly(3-hydroxybutyrate) depolymerase
MWGALLWVVCEISLSHMTGPWTAPVTSTAIYLGLGLVATMRAGDARRQVKAMGVMVMAGHHDPVSSVLHHKLDNLASALIEADELLARGEISPTMHEMTWWRVYDQMPPTSAAAR